MLFASKNFVFSDFTWKKMLLRKMAGGAGETYYNQDGVFKKDV